MSIRVLIAEDEPHIARIIRLSLEKEGFIVDHATNGANALSRYVECRPDILVTDVKMPHMNGKKLVEAIRNRDPENIIPVIVMTSSLENEHTDWVENMSELTFIGKPVSPGNLISVINNYITAPKNHD